MNDLKERNREKALAEMSVLLDAGDSDATILTATKRIYEILKTVTDRACEGVSDTACSTAMAIRCIARKTEEAMAVVIDLVERGNAYQATSLLRPMCEELLFARFIRSLPRSDADQYIRLKTMLEIDEGIHAQDAFFTKQQRDFGWPDGSNPETTILARMEEQRISDGIKDALKSIGDRLGWGKKPKPSAKEMAERTDSLDVYEFFYHAASSSVHASLHHLLRMAWWDSSTKKLTISNKVMEQHHRMFSLIYGAWIASGVISAVTEEFPDTWPDEYDDSFGIWLAILMKPAVVQRSPPIVTKRELLWETIVEADDGRPK
jgi:hypothetical protein